MCRHTIGRGAVRHRIWRLKGQRLVSKLCSSDALDKCTGLRFAEKQSQSLMLHHTNTHPCPSRDNLQRKRNNSFATRWQYVRGGRRTPTLVWKHQTGSVIRRLRRSSPFSAEFQSEQKLITLHDRCDLAYPYEVTLIDARRVALTSQTVACLQRPRLRNGRQST